MKSDREKLIYQYKLLHDSNANYGNSATFLNHISKIIIKNNYTKVIDFGCGKGQLGLKLKKLLPKLEVISYDPAIEEFNVKLKPCDLVIANDVFEHFEPNSIKDELHHINWLAAYGIFANISCRSAVHHLPNGVNCHTSLFSKEKWLDIMGDFFNGKKLEEVQFNEKNKNLRVFYRRKH